ncbi:MAG: pyridoxamine 5'-phosphate oxidase family protein [Alphaproteobacteria bacterium]|nr:pyridoxamine 5'-phosphate oxidase family protein [Alphaproteobacteria bacterium]
MSDPAAVAITARTLLSKAPRASLATLTASGAPYASLVLTADDGAGAPLLLLSDLAEHTKNLARDPRASLLVESVGQAGDPLAAPRATFLGEAARLDDAAAKASFVARHPLAATYADFKDFALYRLAILRIHLVAGFGRIDGISGDQYRTAASVRKSG